MRSACAALALTLFAVGCDESQPTATPRGPSAAAVLFPGPEAETEGRLVARAQQVLVQRCMERRGFAYPRLPEPPEPASDRLPSPRSGYGLYKRITALDPGVARALRDPRRGSVARALQGLTPARRTAFQRALDGSPDVTASVTAGGGSTLTYRTGGCYARATATLQGGLRAYHQRVATRNAIVSRVGAQFARDVRLARAIRGWRACMRARGLQQRSPREARDAIYDAYLRSANPARVRPRELATARVDRRCSLRSGLPHAEARAKRSVLRALSASDQRALAAIGPDEAATQRRARTILDDT